MRLLAYRSDAGVNHRNSDFEGASVTGSAAVMVPGDRQVPVVVGGPAQLQAEREQVTRLLRGLAGRLDELDRELADLAWRHRRPSPGAVVSELLCERTALEKERARLDARLSVLARQLNDLDSRLSDRSGLPSLAVGTCPECGYPSLGSGLCAFCRPHLVR